MINSFLGTGSVHVEKTNPKRTNQDVVTSYRKLYKKSSHQVVGRSLQVNTLENVKKWFTYFLKNIWSCFLSKSQNDRKLTVKARADRLLEFEGKKQKTQTF